MLLNGLGNSSDPEATMEIFVILCCLVYLDMIEKDTAQGVVCVFVVLACIVVAIAGLFWGYVKIFHPL